MKFTAAAAALVGLAAAVPTEIIDLGDGVKLVPREPRAGVRMERLREYRRGLMQTDGAEVAGKNTSDASYSTNWSGAVKIGTGLTDVTGTIVVPTPSVPSGGSSLKQYAASAWVGIDGDTCSTAILQSGVDFYAGRGGVSFGESSASPPPTPPTPFPSPRGPLPPGTFCRSADRRCLSRSSPPPRQTRGTSGTPTTPTPSPASPSPPATRSS